MSETVESPQPQPPLTTAALGLEHVLVMIVAAIALPLIVGRALALPPAAIAMLVNAGLLACGVGTILQSLRVSPLIGAGVPARMSLAFAALGPLLAIAALPGYGDAAARLQVMLGATIAAGVVVALATSGLAWLRPLFPPVVRGTILLMAGIVLLRAAAGWIAAPAERGTLDLGAPGRLALAAAVLAAIALLARYGGKRLGRLGVVIAVAAGAVLASTAGAMSFAGVQAAPAFDLVLPFAFGKPRFEPIAVLVMSLVALVAAMESEALLAAASRASSPSAEPVAIDGGVRAEGLTTALAGVLNAFPCGILAAEPGRAGAAGADARHAATFAGVVLVLLACSPKLGALAVALPQAVLGGAGLVVFGLVAAQGVRTLVDVDYEANRFDLYVVAIALGLGLVPLVAPQFFKVVLAGAPQWAPLLHSSVALTAVAAVLLNLFFNGARRQERVQDRVAPALHGGQQPR